MDENELIKKAIELDEKAFEELFKKYRDYTFKIALYILNDREESSDCVNNAWIKIYYALINKKFRFQSKFSTWIYSIVTNEAILMIKDRPKTIRLDDPFIKENLLLLEKDELSIEEITAKKISIERIMNKLSPLQKKIIELLSEDYSFSEIAEKLGIKENYLYQLSFRIKKLLEN